MLNFTGGITSTSGSQQALVYLYIYYSGMYILINTNSYLGSQIVAVKLTVRLTSETSTS